MSNFVFASLFFIIIFPLAVVLNTLLVVWEYAIFLFHLPINIYKLCLEVVVTIKSRHGSDIQ
jgi:hypothetical protein